MTIPDSVTSIGEGAFSFCSGLTSVTISGSVRSDHYERVAQAITSSDELNKQTTRPSMGNVVESPPVLRDRDEEGRVTTRTTAAQSAWTFKLRC